MCTSACVPMDMDLCRCTYAYVPLHVYLWMCTQVKLPDSYNLRALPDLTGTLRADEVCVVVDGSELPRPISLLDGEPFDILVYGAPGMHPGDIRKLRVASTDALRRMIGSADPSRCNAIFFSIQGERSEQDCSPMHGWNPLRSVP